MRRRVPAMLLALVSVTGTDVAAQVNHSYPDWLAPCSIENITGAALCGKFDVWENRATQTGRRISLEVLVLPAEGPDRQPDPVFWFSGGPGAAATESAPGITGALSGVRGSRDLVYIDQRGTGRSSPLDCEEPAVDSPLQASFREFLPEDYVRACLAAQDADVGQYTTPIAMDDIDEVRAALGYEQINLFGGSYGTRAAQVYMRRHPESVRSAVLHGVAPLDMENPLPFAKALEVGVVGVIEACRAEEACHEAYGRHIIFPNQAHGFANPPCEIKLITDFIVAGNADDLDIGCVAETRRPPFDTSVGRQVP